MYQVFDNDKPAQYPDHKVHPSWDKSCFKTFIEAWNYMQKWLGQYRGLHLSLNKTVDYSGYGDTIEIRKMESK